MGSKEDFMSAGFLSAHAELDTEEFKGCVMSVRFPIVCTALCRTCDASLTSFSSSSLKIISCSSIPYGPVLKRPVLHPGLRHHMFDSERTFDGDPLHLDIEVGGVEAAKQVIAF